MSNIIYNIKKRLVKKISLFPGFREKLFSKRYYSQDGEDVLLSSFYEDKEHYKGFYIDVGSHHPMRFSNTYMFYKKGWNGINIDAMPGSMKAFIKMRPRDINIEIAVSNKYEELEYYLFEESALNSFDKALSEQYINKGWKLKKKQLLKVNPINDVIKKYLPSDKTHIDFISIDVEGMDATILMSINFDKYVPDFFLVEDDNLLGRNIDYTTSEIYNFLCERNYELVAKTLRTGIYKKQ
jgi:hypothetical protein